VRILLAKLLVELCRILDRPMGIVVILIFFIDACQSVDSAKRFKTYWLCWLLV
jgi:hypothetical protein